MLEYSDYKNLRSKPTLNAHRQLEYTSIYQARTSPSITYTRCRTHARTRLRADRTLPSLDAAAARRAARRQLCRRLSAVAAHYSPCPVALQELLPHVAENPLCHGHAGALDAELSTGGTTTSSSL